MDKTQSIWQAVCMARRPKNHDAAQDLGEKLQELHAKTGNNPTSKDIELWIYEAFRTRVATESIRKAHRGEVDPTACDMELLSGLAAYYDVDLEDLGRHAASRRTVVKMLDPTARADLPPRIHGLSTVVQLGLFEPLFELAA